MYTTFVGALGSGRNGGTNAEGRAMFRLIKVLFYLVVLAGLGFVAYAYLGPVFFPQDFAAPQTEFTIPITLETD